MEPIKKEKEVKVYKLEYYCPKCDKKLKQSNITLTTWPPQFVLYCEACKYEVTMYDQQDKIYYESFKKEV